MMIEKYMCRHRIKFDISVYQKQRGELKNNQREDGLSNKRVIRLKTGFLIAIVETRRQWNVAINVLGKNSCQFRILYPIKSSFKRGKMTFQSNKLSLLLIDFSIKEILKDVL